MYLIKKNSRVPIYEKEAFAEYLSDMSEKGWRFVEADAEDTEPNYYRKKLVFESLEGKRLYYGIGALDEADYQKRNEFISSCESMGWKYVSKIGKLYIFCSESGRLPPIPSDMNTEAEIVEQLKPKSMPDAYQIILTLFFLITIALAATVYNDDALSFFTSDFLLLGWIFILISIAATAVGRLISKSRYKKAYEAVCAHQTPRKREYKASVFKKRSLYIVSGLFLAPVLMLLLFNPYRFGSAATANASNSSGNIKLSSIVKVEKLRRESGSEKLSCLADFDYYYQESLPKEDGAGAALSTSESEQLGAVITNDKYTIKPVSSENPRMTVLNFTFYSPEIAREVYERDRSFNPLDETQNEPPKTDFSKEECEKLKIAMGRYYYHENSGFLQLILLDGDTYTIIYMNMLGGYNEKIAAAIAGR